MRTPLLPPQPLRLGDSPSLHQLHSPCYTCDGLLAELPACPWPPLVVTDSLPPNSLPHRRCGGATRALLKGLRPLGARRSSCVTRAVRCPAPSRCACGHSWMPCWAPHIPLLHRKPPLPPISRERGGPGPCGIA